MTHYLMLTLAAHYYRGQLHSNTQKFLVAAGACRGMAMNARVTETHGIVLPWGAK